MAVKKVLIIDDQHGIRALLNEVFTVFGYEVLEASNGYKGLSVFQTHSPDIVLLDMKMPGLSGIETLREMRKINTKVPVILVTAYQELDIMDEAQRLGVVDKLIKPFDLEELHKVVMRVAPPRTEEVAGA